MFDFMKSKEDEPELNLELHKELRLEKTDQQRAVENERLINRPQPKRMGVDSIKNLGYPYDSAPIDFDDGKSRIASRLKLRNKDYCSSLSALGRLTTFGEPLISRAVHEGCLSKGGSKSVVRGVIKHIYPERHFLKNCIKPDKLPSKKSVTVNQGKSITLAAILDLVPLDKGYESIDLRVSSNLVTKLQLASVFTKQLTGSIVEAALGEYFKTMEINK